MAITPDGNFSLIFAERSMPHSIIVDYSGERYVNESTSYVDVWASIYRRNAKTKATP